MGCHELILDNKVVGHICKPHLEKKVVGRTNKKWCFKCCIYIVHDKVLYSEILRYDDKGQLINGYYEPFCQYECRQCHEDNTRFPGW